MSISAGPAEHNEKEIKTRWPVEEGLTAGTQKQTGERYLKAEVQSNIRKKDKTGID